MKYPTVKKFTLVCMTCYTNKTKHQFGINLHGVSDGFVFSCYEYGTTEHIKLTGTPKPKTKDQAETMGKKVYE